MESNTARANANRFRQLPLGIQLAAAALVVAVPRYVIAFLAADNIRFYELVEGILLGVSAIATAIIVAGGGAYVAHIVASAQGHAFKRALLLGLWLVLLACEIVLLAPPVVASLRKTQLAHVLVAPWFDALWSVVMVATPALCAAACVLAASLTTQSEPQPVAIYTVTPVDSDTSPVDKPQSTPEPVAVAPVEVHCPNECGRSFRNQQALAAHLRHCNAQLATQPVTVSTNGNHP